jgi:hypothetical protein
MMAVGYFLALAISLGLAGLWYRTSPENGSGWAMVGAVLVGLCVGGTASPAGDILVSGVGALAYFTFWYRTRGMQHAVWLMVMGILFTLSLLVDLT